MVFSAVSMDSSFEVVDLARVGERNKTNNCMLRVRSRMKSEREKSFSTAALCKQKRNGPVAIL